MIDQKKLRRARRELGQIVRARKRMFNRDSLSIQHLAKCALIECHNMRELGSEQVLCLPTNLGVLATSGLTRGLPWKQVQEFVVQDEVKDKP